MRKFFFSIPAILATSVVVVACSSSEPTIEQGPYKGKTYAQVNDEMNLGTANDYNKQVCKYIHAYSQTGPFNDDDFSTLAADIVADNDLDYNLGVQYVSRKAGSIIGASVLSACPEYKQTLENIY